MRPRRGKEWNSHSRPGEHAHGLYVQDAPGQLMWRRKRRRNEWPVSAFGVWAAQPQWTDRHLWLLLLVIERICVRRPAVKLSGIRFSAQADSSKERKKERSSLDARIGSGSFYGDLSILMWGTKRPRE